MSTDPGVEVLIWTVQLPLVVVQVLTPPTKAAPALLFSRLRVQVVPFGAGPKPVTASPGAPAGRPSSCWIVHVIVCAWFTSFVAVSGLRAICASTYTWWASAESLRPVRLARVTETSARPHAGVAGLSTERG